jgi:hypothetical protein
MWNPSISAHLKFTPLKTRRVKSILTWSINRSNLSRQLYKHYTVNWFYQYRFFWCVCVCVYIGGNKTKELNYIRRKWRLHTVPVPSSLRTNLETQIPLESLTFSRVRNAWRNNLNNYLILRKGLSIGRCASLSFKLALSVNIVGNTVFYLHPYYSQAHRDIVIRMTASEADPSFGLPNPVIQASQKILVKLVYHPYAANMLKGTPFLTTFGASCRSVVYIISHFGCV